MSATEIMRELEALGAESYRKVLFNHGVREPIFGVKVEELKKIQKRVRKDHELAQQLFATGNYDAQYLAGLIVDDVRMTEADLQRWLETANSDPLSATIVAWVAAESPHGAKMALKWIDSADERTAQTGWAALSSLVSVRGDTALNQVELRRLLERVEREIHQAPDRVRYAMNGCVIALGSYVPALTDAALAAGERIGPVSVDMGKTACRVPHAPDYIRKLLARGTVGRLRKTARC